MVNASLNLEKCHFGCMEGILLGHIVLEDGIRIDCTKIEKVNFFPSPKIKRQLQAFLGQVGYY
jgi:hypothetical protein